MTERESATVTFVAAYTRRASDRVETDSIRSKAIFELVEEQQEQQEED